MKRISVDNGKTFCTIEEAIEALTYDDGEEIDLDTLGYAMRGDILDRILSEIAVFDVTDIIKNYLKLADHDLIMDIVE